MKTSSKPIQFIAALTLSAFAAVAADNSGTFNVLDYGAKGDGTNNDTAAVQQAVDACAANGGGQVILPGGKIFLTGAITLRSGVDFHLARGAVLRGSPRWQDYGEAGALVFAMNATNLTVSGDGVLDGNDHAVWQQLADETAGGNVNRPGWWPQSFCGVWWPFGRSASDKSLVPGRPMQIILIGCQQVRVRGITIRNAPSWTVHTIGCDDLVIDGISILNDWNVPNNDGIDLDHCRNVRVANCHIDTADDGIVLKNTPNFASYGRCENITVTGCTIKSRSAGLKIDEIYTAPGVRNVVFDACVIYQSNRGLCVQGRDEGDIENVLFSNITIETQLQPGKWWGAGEAIYVSNRPRNPGTKLAHLRQIRFSNILCQGENGIYLRGSTNQPIEDVVFDNVRVQLGKTTDIPGGFYDDRPIGGASAGGQFNGVYKSPIAGIFARDVDGLTLRNMQVVWDTPKNSIFGEALDEDQVQNLTLDHDSFNSTAPAR
jgi:polygalacturonase